MARRAHPAPTALSQAGMKLRDRIAQLRALVDAEGLMIANSQGRRLHPAVSEIRAQQLTLARLLATLQVPSLDEDSLPASRGVRGVYSIGA